MGKVDRTVRAVCEKLAHVQPPSINDTLDTIQTAVRQHGTRRMTRFLDFHQDLVAKVARPGLETVIEKWSEYPPKSMCEHMCAVYFQALFLLVAEFRKK